MHSASHARITYSFIDPESMCGKFGMEPTTELRESMKSCKVTNLVSENAFGDLDFSQFRRRHASLHYHSGIQMVKRNKTISAWLAATPEIEQDSFNENCQELKAKLLNRRICARQKNS